MATNNHTPLLDQLFAASYADQEPLFEGYKPDTSFQYGGRVLVFKRAPSAPNGSAVAMFETRMPASFFSLEATGPDGVKIKADTGSGREMAELSHQLAVALSAGIATFVPVSGRDWSQTHAYRPSAGNSEGVATFVFEDFDAQGSWFRLDVPEHTTWDGKRRPALSLFIRYDLSLVLSLAEALRQGMFGFEVVPG